MLFDDDLRVRGRAISRISKVPIDGDLMLLKNSEYGIKISAVTLKDVERGVKMITEAATSVTQDQRHGFIINTINSLQRMPLLNTHVSVSPLLLLQVERGYDFKDVQT